MSKSDFYCTCCGQRNIPIIRKSGQARSSGHLKKLFCVHCQEEHNCVEVVEGGTKYTYEDFMFEYSHGNFNPDGTRKMTYGELKHKERS